ncbi:SGNH/GDSL hydrolase family protein [uncultured Clostridium sp.]|uniref:SGNH/GDSL hydrolase family protein n=1 Tax=uncultured Clostridium sp. TaxID=59620 RepID=UPI0025DA9A07|nr:SGNH/GDSL hydrolase family protein [uncultured Clostridium sp.]
MNVAIIGGLITEGAGASCYENTFAYKLEQYLKSRYEKLKFLNLGAGGTASNFGLFRLKRDLGSFKPDVIFVEFAVNDRIYSVLDSSIYFEGLIRECSKYTDKIIIIDMPTGMSDACTPIHKKVAYFYNLPVIDVQDEVWRKIGNREITWTKISIDNLHPNDKGHELYYEIIKNSLEKIDLEQIKIRIDYRVINRYKFINPLLIEHSNKQIEYYGKWKEDDYNLNNKFRCGAVSCNIGDGVIFKFKGKHLAMMNLMSRDSGRLACQLDEKYGFYVDLFMDSDGHFDTTININNLENTEHTLTMIIDKERNPKSSGNKIVIGGFLIDPGKID